MLMLCLLWLDRHMKGNSPVAALFGSAQAPRFPDISVTIFFSAQPPVFPMPLCQTAILSTLLLFTSTLTLLSHSRKKNTKKHIKEIPLSIFLVQNQQRNLIFS
jgi:hypothetical protein